MNQLLLRSFCCAALFATSLGWSEERPSISLGERGNSQLLRKLEAGEDIHVAFLGGSITQKHTGYAGMFSKWLGEKWPEVDFTITNAGLASTCSVWGASRLERDVLSKGDVDLLVVEFAVNDDQDARYEYDMAVRGMEGVVRQYFAANPDGDIIMIHFPNGAIMDAKEEGKEAIAVQAHRDVGEHYGLAMVDVGDELKKEIGAGRMTWKEDYGGTHPNDSGYRFVTDLLVKLFEQGRAAESTLSIEMPNPLNEAAFENVTLLSPGKTQWHGGWQYEPAKESDLNKADRLRWNYFKQPLLHSREAGDYVSVPFNGTALGAFVLAGPDAGILEVAIDGGEWQAYDLYHFYSKQLPYPRGVLIADELADGPHMATIRISTEKNELSEGTTASILDFYVNH